MTSALELLTLLTVRRFCVVQQQKRVADAMIEAEATKPQFSARTGASAFERLTTGKNSIEDAAHLCKGIDTIVGSLE